MSFEIPYKQTTEPERATASGPVNLDTIGEVIDGYAPDWRPVASHEDVGHLNASLEASEALIKRMEMHLRFMHEVLAEIHVLTDCKHDRPGTNLDLIRVKAQVALRQAAKSGLLT
ncbi:MAG: hypothetical protein BWY57_02945 [Betaproteobacteria bacterium ADurb.Bin341]|nr:MAG: hypothetical protein BWY57_02945 [Betaproteobacteria bacterium ADurb.Bin341]